MGLLLPSLLRDALLRLDSLLLSVLGQVDPTVIAVHTVPEKLLLALGARLEERPLALRTEPSVTAIPAVATVRTATLVAEKGKRFSVLQSAFMIKLLHPVLVGLSQAVERLLSFSGSVWHHCQATPVFTLPEVDSLNLVK